MKFHRLALTLLLASDLTGAAPQELPLDLLDDSSGVNLAAWRIGNLQASLTEPAAERFGAHAIRFEGDAARDAAKGDIGLHGRVPEGLTQLSLSVFLPEAANVARVGYQLRDAEGEMLVYTVEADWTGWRRVDLDPVAAPFKQAYRQEDKNGVLDLPIHGVSFVWYTETAGVTSVAIDGLTARVEGIPVREEMSLQLGAVAAVEEGEAGEAMIEVTNYGESPVTIEIEYGLQRNSDFYDYAPPHPQLGRDEALGQLSWTERDGQRVSEGTLTDREANTAYGFSWGSDVVEAFQVIDLGAVRPVTHLQKQAGDANWIFQVDILASEDGREYRAIEGWQGLNWKGEWGVRTLAAAEPFEARFLKFRYHDGGEPMQTLRLPTAIAVYNGMADEPLEFPEVGETIDSGSVSLEVPARGFTVVPLRAGQALTQGAYLLAVRRTSQSPQGNWLSWSNLLVLPEPMDSLSPESPFGSNGAVARLADWNHRLGIGWIRFENLKWPMVSPAPDQFAFDGSVGPWHMNMDEYVETYVDLGISVLPYLFQVPVFESSAPEGTEKNIKQYAPKNFEEYGKFVFQTVARYGRREHPDEVLLTEDKVSGLGWMDTYELWNEPNLNDPGWGHWVGEYDDYLEMFRIGAEAVKRADPTAKVTNGGLAGTELGLVDRFRSYRYDDGKRPLDFIDVINVHHYTQPFAPEVATINTNIDRSGTEGGALTFEENLLSLSDWRARFKPDSEIWLTETGFDTGGPRGVSIRTQAAYTPRNILMILGSGIDKVFIFREMGSNPHLYAAAGVLDEDGSPKPSFLTYATLIRVMDGAERFTRLPHPNPNVRLYGAIKDGEPVVAAWSVEGTESLAMDFGEGIVTGPFGRVESRPIGPDFELTIFPRYFEGVNKERLRDLFIRAEEAKQERRSEFARKSALKVELFDFGESEVGAATIGEVRPFLPVGPNTIYSGETGYGFVKPHDMRQSIDRHWIRDPLERDGVKIIEGNVFRFDAKPGKYQLSFKIVSLGGEAKVVARGLSGGERSWTVGKDAEAVEAAVEVAAGPIEIALPEDYGVFYWISLIERE